MRGESVCPVHSLILQCLEQHQLHSRPLLNICGRNEQGGYFQSRLNLLELSSVYHECLLRVQVGSLRKPKLHMAGVCLSCSPSSAWLGVRGVDSAATLAGFKSQVL